MTALARDEIVQWKGGAVRGPMHAHCDSCGRDRDDDGKPLFVARQRGAKRKLCVDCWSLRKTR